MRKNTVLQIRNMAIKRYPRLMIPVLVSSIIAYLFINFLESDASSLSSWASSYGSSKYSFTFALLSGAFYSFIYGDSSLNPVLWTMRIEFIGSFVIFIICYIKITKKVKVLETIYLLLLIILFKLKIIDLKMTLGIMSFIVGYFYYFYGKNVKLRISILILLLGLYCAGAHNQSLSYNYFYTIFHSKTYLILNFVSGITIIYSIIFNSTFNKFFSKDFLVKMGKISFSAYLIHLPVMRFIGVPFFIFYYKFLPYDYSAILASITSLILTYVLSLLFYNYIDKVSLKFTNVLINLIKRKKELSTREFR